MTSIVFEEPPTDGRHVRSGWQPIAESLKDRPGEWARVAEGVGRHIGQQISHGRVKAFTPGGSFEATCRPNPDGSFNVWARYVGEL